MTREHAVGSRRGHALVGAGILWLGSASTVALGTALGARLLVLVDGAARWRVDGLVELGVVAVGVAALLWLALSCAVAAGCVTTRAAGGGWRRGEAWVHRWAPAVVRRAVVLTVGAGLGLSAATGASAADVVMVSPTPTVTAGTSTGAPEPDLGWVPTGQGTTASPQTAGAIEANPRTGSAATAAPTATRGPATDGTQGAHPDGAGVSADGATAGRTPSAGTGTGTAASPSPTTAATSPTVSARGAAPADTAAPPVGTARTVADGAPVRRATAGTTVTVAPGDSLWSIAAQHLPAGAGPAQIAAAWPQWYAANAGAIGDDPGLILPGQQLAVPTEAAGAAS